jgi:hypothetical protein
VTVFPYDVESAAALTYPAVYRPTVLSSVDPSMRISNDEIFGPVCTIHPFDTPAEAVAMANDTTYGLSAALGEAVGPPPGGGCAGENMATGPSSRWHDEPHGRCPPL